MRSSGLSDDERHQGRESLTPGAIRNDEKQLCLTPAAELRKPCKYREKRVKVAVFQCCTIGRSVTSPFRFTVSIEVVFDTHRDRLLTTELIRLSGNNS